MNTLTEDKEKVWNYIMSLPKKYRPFECTEKRLAKAKRIILNQEYFWDDIYWRHGLQYNSLEGLEKSDKETYDHCVGNFWGMTMEIMLRAGIYKI
jgi:hypothetical protein